MTEYTLPEPTWHGDIPAYSKATVEAAYAAGLEAGRKVPEGWKLVPTLPTQKMTKAAVDAWLDCGSRILLVKANQAVRVGIAAAPEYKP